MKKGFTLIELLVVIAIIGILAAMILASITGTRAKARDARRANDIRQVKTALELYQNENDKYPVAGDQATPTTTAWTTMSGLLTGSGSMKQVPTDPTNSGNYVYKYGSADGSTYKITYTTETNTGNPNCDSTTKVCTITPD